MSVIISITCFRSSLVCELSAPNKILELEIMSSVEMMWLHRKKKTGKKKLPLQKMTDW